ncbi:MAG: hypothetical protein R3E84_02160 [Pseudomonadales bacterium]
MSCAETDGDLPLPAENIGCFRNGPDGFILRADTAWVTGRVNFLLAHRSRVVALCNVPTRVS